MSPVTSEAAVEGAALHSVVGGFGAQGAVADEREAAGIDLVARGVRGDYGSGAALGKIEVVFCRRRRCQCGLRR
jgi:hypothetical protein